MFLRSSGLGSFKDKQNCPSMFTRNMCIMIVKSNVNKSEKKLEFIIASPCSPAFGPVDFHNLANSGYKMQVYIWNCTMLIGTVT